MDESGPSILFSIRGFFTPTVLFVVLNIVIATIALTSRTVRHHHHQEPAPDHPNHHRPGPTSLERARSIGLFRFGSRDLPHEPEPEPDHTHQTHYHQHHQPSALERVRSGLFRFGSRDLPHQPEPDHTHQSHYHPHHQPSALERVRSGIFGFGSSDLPNQPEPDQTHQTHYQQHQQPSALERVRSGIFGFGSRDIPQPDAQHFQAQTAAPEPEYYDMDHHFRRIQSESARPKPVMAEERGALRKLASALSWRAPEVRRRPVAAAAEEEEEEEVDARADDFINRFKQQLKLQRLDSIMRYKEMLTRGR
ncbi:proline-rich receptor-like protein kinase PERK12 [Iris pallida]|uniref:Proline-rich receptor-like protein kinase PERK12 n=1 Tax=Iris pallida TaxID=29817 RepID=A0AAX6HJ27_IRIPA|nr:proline-rich receptor-like protein kinase PERK12 [Iris pallida]